MHILPFSGIRRPTGKNRPADTRQGQPQRPGGSFFQVLFRIIQWKTQIVQTNHLAFLLCRIEASATA